MDMVSNEDIDLFATLNFYPSGQPSEIFVRQQKEGSTVGALVDALMTVVSIGLQYGIPWNVFADKLRHTRFPPYGMTRDEQLNDLRQVSSVLDYVVRWTCHAIEERTKAQSNADSDADS
jgi:ribonucleoside-diphosphate reductase alpha chain